MSIEDIENNSICDTDTFAHYVALNLSHITGYELFSYSTIFLPNRYRLKLEGLGHNKSLDVELLKTVDIQKWASPEDYPFIDEDQGNYYIYRGFAPREYDRVLNSALRDIRRFNLGVKGIGNVKEDAYLTIGDKQFLSAIHQISFTIKLPDMWCYSMKEVIDVTKILLSIIG